MKVLLAAALALAPMATTFAQEMKPPKQVTDLGWLVGKWSGSGELTFGTQKMTLSTTITCSFEGYFLKAVSSDSGGGFTLTKTEMIGWDDKKGEYVSYTFTNIAPAARIAHGKPEADKLVMTAEPWEAEGMTSVMRESLSKLSPTKLDLSIESKKGDKWDKQMGYPLTKQ